tara:strand:- start:523 stop:1035 length:513 start_codon:yes stop_codon:yes gene_type:complete
MAGIVGLTEIQHQNGTSALSIDSNGLMTPSVKHAFYMYRNTTQTITNGAGPVLIQFDASRINEGNGVTLGASARYTVPAGGGGIYVLHAHGRFNSGTDGNCSIGIFVNGAGVATSYYYNEYYDGMTVSVLRNMSASDYVEMKMANSVGNNLNIGAPDAGDTVFLWGYRLG